MRFLHSFVRSLSILLLITTCLSDFYTATAVYAQSGAFNSGSNGSDGALNLAIPGTYLFNPKTFNPPLDADGDNIYHFTSINISAGVTVTLSGKVINGPVYWLASGAVTIDGVVDLSGKEGYSNAATPAERTPSVPGSGGFPGGIDGDGSFPAQSGFGPGGGQSYIKNGVYCNGGAGHADMGTGGVRCGGATYGNTYLVPLIGGSGGGALNNFKTGGGAGGGAILIASSTSIAVNGSILANMGYDGQNKEGGGGSGGSIRLVAPILTGAGKLQAYGCLQCTAGLGGADGRIRLEAFIHNFTGSFNPSPIRRSPIPLFLPTHAPSSVRVVKVDNTTTPQLPANEVASPDVTITNGGAVTVTIEARYVPVGSLVNLVLIPEEVPDQIHVSTPLVGTLQQSSAIVTMTIPTGHSRMFVYSKWTQ